MSNIGKSGIPGSINAYEEGFKAFGYGKTRLDNPYARYSAPFCRWNEGWRAKRAQGSVNGILWKINLLAKSGEKL